MSSASQVETQSGVIAAQSQSPQLTWDIGTAYDFFMSLEVLHHPDDYGLRASWAAGVRSRRGRSWCGAFGSVRAPSLIVPPWTVR